MTGPVITSLLEAVQHDVHILFPGPPDVSRGA